MAGQDFDVVTGAFGYSGKYIAKRLLENGHRVLTITNSIHRENPFNHQIDVARFNFDNPELLKKSLEGGKVLYNTYWVRFNHKTFTFADAIKNTETLFNAARAAGIERIVHVSITNPSIDSPLEYFRGKALVEAFLKKTGISYAILRPTVLFGKEDILINNIAWAIRRFPVFGIFGDGQYRLQPIYVDDLARLAVEEGKKHDNVIINAIGPETFTYRGLVEMICRVLNVRRMLVSVSPMIGFLAGWMIGKSTGDVLVTRDEMRGLMDELLYVDAPPAGTTRLSEWITNHKNSAGERYTSELERRTNRQKAYR